MTGIYKIKNRLNRKVYVGESVNIKNRWSQHKSDLGRGKHHCERLQKDWKKFGGRAFKFSVVERFWFTKHANPDKLKIALLLREGYWTDRWNALLDYNTEDSLSELKKFADLGKGNPKFKKYRRYRKFIRRHMWFAKHWSPPLLTATLYNPFLKWGLILGIAYGIYYFLMGGGVVG